MIHRGFDHGWQRIRYGRTACANKGGGASRLACRRPHLLRAAKPNACKRQASFVEVAYCLGLRVFRNRQS